MNEQRNNGKGIFYGVIGVATLIVAIIGATFAYFTATQTAGENVITGNAATISFGLSVIKVTTVDESKGGMIPMTDKMVGAAVSSTNGACVDDTGNAVCQIYKVTVNNTGTASMFVDGYVDVTGTAATSVMRWAQVFSTGENTYSVTGTPNLAVSQQGVTALGFTGAASDTTSIDQTGTTGTYTLSGNTYTYINKNYMRTSGHGISEASYSRTDLSSALVFSQYLTAGTGTNADTTNATRDLYFVVWLSETGSDQTLEGSDAVSFFQGKVTFLSGEGAETSATFNGYTRTAKTS